MFNEAVLTKKGIALNNKVQAGSATIEYLRVGLGKGIYEKNEKLEDQERLKEEKQSIPISSIKIIDEKTVKLRVVINNEEITEGYDITEIGLYATDPDEGEILYSVAIATEGKVDYQPSKTEVVDYQITIDLYSTVSNTNNATIKLDTGAVASADDLIQLKEDMSKGDISETVIETLDTIEDKYPVPAAGESVKRFFGKVLTFLRNIRPLTGDITLYVSASTGSDTAGDGSESSPYASVTKALSVIPKDLSGYVATLNIATGTYAESINIGGFIGGRIEVFISGNITINDLTVDNSYILCRGQDATYTITLGWIRAINRAAISMYDSINVLTTSYISDSGNNVSILALASDVYMSGVISLSGNTGVAVKAGVHSQVYVGIIKGTGFTSGLMAMNGARIGYRINQLSATTVLDAKTYGLIVKGYGAIIGTLQTDVTLYVSTTGSDTTGNGTSGSPFKTIQHAIDIIPKDLGGYTANVIIAGGTYDEDVHIAGFYPGTGRIMVYLSGNVVIRGFTVSGSHVIISSYDSVLHNLTAQYVLVQDIATLNMWAQINLTTTWYIVDPLTTTSRISIIVTRNSALYLSGITTITGNDAVGVFVGNMSQAYIAIITGSGYTVGIYSVTGSRVSIVSNLISAITPYAQTGGGIFTYGNGTQISGIISSGLSCTWGTLGGGYIRHGNMVGTAMVTISLEVATTSTLSQGVDYVINGVPLPIGVSVVVSHNYATQIGDCFIDGYTTHIRIKPQSSIAIGTHILFTVTYLTVS